MNEPRIDQCEPIPGQILERIWFYVNFECNLACSYCVAASGPGSRRARLDLGTFRRLADEAVGLGFRQLIITGGEPLLHPDILAMLQHAGASKDALLLTNATVIASPRLRGLRELSRLVAVQVSLDSADPAIHDRFRGEGSWRRAVEGLTRLMEWGFDLSVRATQVDQSDAEMEALDIFLGQLGVPATRSFAAPVAVGGRSRTGLKLETSDLLAEPTVAADGLYPHPLKIDLTTAITPDVLPLKSAVALLAGQVAASNPPNEKRRYR